MSYLGLTEDQEHIYRLCLREPGIGLDGLIDQLRLPPNAARRELRRLRELGLLRGGGNSHGRSPAGDDALLAADPDVAVARLLDLRLHELHEKLQRVTQLQPLVASLRAERGEVREPAVVGIEQLTDPPKIRDRIDDLAFFAREEVALVEPAIALRPEEIEQSCPRVLRCLRRGLSVRTVLVRKALDHPPTVAHLRELESHGARVRLVNHTTAKIQMYDRRTAVVPVDPEDATRGALFAQESGLVSNILALFESIWAESEDLGVLLGEWRAVEEDGPSELERMVLRAMCSGGKDEAGARDLGVSVRTYRRYIAELMQLLGAGNRPQAALLARERGWI
ncbi:LuxR family transcriptional regulator [Streptomyces abyssalis]|uniref:LuxR family transcriptional regulator n=2 Tax=Streptomyces abyssalis TaxID=933944 RepID=A0A1E7JR26_9ACTN|nr:LuxR family transcriptional regulator [Streptomyces abyssalis]OEU90716.1 LuxR family transcriptional regulator [Streptomyces abyssalis]OEV30409.1 LuxR family transcriptional regulator [Streptomyces nanshensis]